ncbi:vacuolar membrane-associated protein iml1 [Rhizina undulata]
MSDSSSSTVKGYPPKMAAAGNLHPPSIAHTYTTSYYSHANANSKTLTLWIHDPDSNASVFKNEAVLNYELFPPGIAKPGDIAEVRLLRPRTAANAGDGNGRDGYAASIAGTIDGYGGGEPMERKRSFPGSVLAGAEDERSAYAAAQPKAVDDGKKFLFVIRELQPEQRARPNMQISLASNVASLFGFHSRATVVVTIVDKAQHEASHVEIYFRDQYISRSDMWRLTISVLSDTCPFNSQKILFIHSIRATVGNIYVRGTKVQSAYFSSRTIPIYRSESARYVLFVQMSQEMWHFDTDDGGEGDAVGDKYKGGKGDPDFACRGAGGVGGEIVFNKLINGFLPELFKRWRRINARHLVSIILFTRIVYEHGEPVGIINNNSANSSEEFLGTPGGINIGEGRRYRDFFRVVVNSMASAEWPIILHRLKREFTLFLRDILIQPMPEAQETFLDPHCDDGTLAGSSSVSVNSRPTTPAVQHFSDKWRSSASMSSPSPRLPSKTSSTPYAYSPFERPPPPPPTKEPKMIITGRPSAAIHGNILEAINLATLQFSKDYVDRDLLRTGINIVVITPGTGHFEVDYEMLKATTEGLISNGMGVDLVCLSKVPLHIVPLFKYRNPAPPPPPPPDFSQTTVPSRSEGKIFAGMEAFNVFKSPPPPPPQQPTENQQQPGEWVYAIPHWIDISFWSSASEKRSKKPPLHQSPHGHLDKKFSPKKRQTTPGVGGGGFKARAKMYELQMMGIIENEVSEIAIPLLHHSPLWRPMPVERTDNRKLKEKERDKDKDKDKERDTKKEDAFAWMDEYDELAFRPIPVLTAALKAAEKRKLATEEEFDKKIKKTLEEDDPLVLGTSFREANLTARGTAATGGGFFDRKMKERRPELESPIETKGGESASAAASGGILGRPARLARQISFGFKSWGVPKATAKTGLASTEIPGFTMTPASGSLGGSGGVTVTRGFDTGSGSSDGVPKSPMSPKGTTASDGVVSPEKLWGSRPISIKGSAVSSLEAAGRDRDRRRSIVGSPLEGRAALRGEMGMMGGASLSRVVGGNRSEIVGNAEKSASVPSGSLSPHSALLPWVIITNPCNPKQNPPTIINQFRRWHHVFPKPRKISQVKWKSLCSPAALPLTTEHFPTAEQLRDEYQENPYVISQNEDDELEDTAGGNREELVRAMISQRLAQGFQIVVGPAVAEATGGRGGDPGIFDKLYMVRGGSSCFMSLGSQIHQLICDEEYNVEVKRYVRKPNPLESGEAKVQKYTTYIKTVMGDEYLPVNASFRPPLTEYNWNYVDQYIGGYEDTLTDQLRYWRARFVLIPNDPPETARRSHLSNQNGGVELNDEEIRLEGIRRLTQLFQRNRYIPPAERRFEKYGRRRGKEKNPLQILYKTVDPSVVVAQELETLSQGDSDAAMRRSQLLTTEMFEKKNLDIKAIAQELQGPRGVRLQDRRWHLKFHSNCFIGEEMVTWILENFKDIETRQEAEEVGLKLFKEGLFQHVDKRHEFRDGNYFFRIAEAYTIPQHRPTSKGGWFGTFKTDRSVPSTPMGSDSYSQFYGTRSRSSTIATDESSGSFRTPTPSIAGGIQGSGKKKPEVVLSKVMKYDVDPLKKSYRRELINLHYDRIHNPDNCYHIRIDWMNTTAKLIEDSLTSWARTVDRYGLKLVEAPIDEACTFPSVNPFRSPFVIKLAVPPPDPYYGTENMEMSIILPAHLPDPYFYHKAILKKFNFVLDTEAARNFPPDVKVRYSWGEPNYRWSQYIHRSGVIFCQINDEGHFLIMANRLYTLRVGIGRDYSITGGGSAGRFDHGRRTERGDDHDRYASSAWAGASISGGAGPSSPAYPPPNVSVGSNGETITPEGLKMELENFCKDEDALRRFYDEVGCSSRAVSPSTIAPVQQVPSLGLQTLPIAAGSYIGGGGSPVVGPVGYGSATTVASSVTVTGRTTSLRSGRNSIVEGMGDDFLLQRER